MFFTLKKEDYKILEFDSYVKQFNNYFIPDEFFFINIFNYKNIPYTIDNNYIICHSNTNLTQAIQFNNNSFKQIIKSNKNTIFIRKINNYEKIDYFKNYNF